MKRIDIHSHMIPRKLPDFEKKFGYKGFPSIIQCYSDYSIMKIDGEGERKINADLWDPTTRIKDFSKNNITKQVVSTMPVLFSYWAPKNDALDVSKFLNDEFINLLNDFPDQFEALATIPMQAPDLAVKEIERCKRNGIKGIQIGSNVNGECISLDKYSCIFDSIIENNMCLLVHPWNVFGSNHLKKYWLQWLVGMPSETSRVICSFIFSGIFEKHKDLRIAFSHSGGSFAGTFSRIKHGFEARPDICAIDNNINPIDYLGRFYVDSIVHDRKTLDFVISVFGVDSILLGSDYPFPLGELSQGNIIDSNPNISKEDKAKIFNKNPLKWLYNI